MIPFLWWNARLILKPRSETPNPKSKFLDPTPCTSYPKPETPNPKPETADKDDQTNFWGALGKKYRY